MYAAVVVVCVYLVLHFVDDMAKIYFYTHRQNMDSCIYSHTVYS